MRAAARLDLLAVEAERAANASNFSHSARACSGSPISESAAASQKEQIAKVPSLAGGPSSVSSTR